MTLLSLIVDLNPGSILNMRDLSVPASKGDLLRFPWSKMWMLNPSFMIHETNNKGKYLIVCIMSEKTLWMEKHWTLFIFIHFCDQLSNMLSTQVFEENTRLQQKIQQSIYNLLHMYSFTQLSSSFLWCYIPNKWIELCQEVFRRFEKNMLKAAVKASYTLIKLMRMRREWDFLIESIQN